MAHYIGTIEERNGEQEYTHNFLFTSKNPEATLRRVAREWYGKPDKWAGEDGGWYFLGGQIYVSPYSFRGISKEDYETIKRLNSFTEL